MINQTTITRPVELAAVRAASALPNYGNWNSRLATRIKTALAAFLEALDYADDLGWDAWDFALDCPAMRDLNLSKSDLRWLIGKGLIDHAVEVTSPHDADRKFSRGSRPLFSKKTCFVLTSAGREMARAMLECADSAIPRVDFARPKLASVARAAQPEPLLPQWYRDRQELRVGSVVVKRFKVPAANQEIVLAAFEEEGWPVRIDDPLPPRPDQAPKRRLQETIKSLNRNHKSALMRFVGDGSGQGVRWEFRSELSDAQDEFPLQRTSSLERA